MSAATKTCIVSLALLATSLRTEAGTWTALNHQPNFNANTMFLMTDGRVLVQDEGDSDWYIWTPDAFGSYRNGTFTPADKTNWTRLYYASGVLGNGKIVVAGGEYSNGGSETNKTEVYDPLIDLWTEISPPTGWNNIGDAPNVIMADGRFFLGSIFDNRTAMLNPTTLTWTAAPNAPNAQLTEETWILLPEGTALKWHCVGHPGSAKYNPTTNTWINCGNLPVDLVLPGSLETGAAILLPDGRTFCIGGPPHTALYTQGANATSPGTWTAGPNTPKINGRDIGAEDAPASFLPNGNVLCCFGPVTSSGGTFETPTYFFEYDTATNALVRITDPPGSNEVPYKGHMLVLPTGEVAWCNAHHAIQLYTNGLPYDPAWKPVITFVETSLERGTTYTLNGLLLNGVTNGSSYGDEAYSATNYPLVRLTSQTTSQVYYARTFDHSTMGVQTGTTPVSTNFVIGSSVPAGIYDLQVVTSGIPSDSVMVRIKEEFHVRLYQILRGTPNGGGLTDVRDSDDNYLRVRNGPAATATGPVVQVAFVGQSPIANPSELFIVTETGVSDPNTTRFVYAYNVTTGNYDLLEAAAAPLPDTSSTVAITSGASNYVNPGSRAVKVIIGFSKALPPNVLWEARFDQVGFAVD
jgi:hypothetical protein